MVTKQRKDDGLIQLVHIVQEEDGFCYFALHSDLEIKRQGGLSVLEAELASKCIWFERLGYLHAQRDREGSIAFTTRQLERLVLRSSRRMALTNNSVEVQYLALDPIGGGRN
jgi:hypothetical protein